MICRDNRRVAELDQKLAAAIELFMMLRNYCPVLLAMAEEIALSAEALHAKLTQPHIHLTHNPAWFALMTTRPD